MVSLLPSALYGIEQCGDRQAQARGGAHAWDAGSDRRKRDAVRREQEEGMDG